MSIKKYRGKGVGKRFLEEIKKFLSDKKLLIVEVETEKNAKDKQELTIIEKRLRYYLNSGFEKCERLEYKMFNVDYYILTYSKSVNKITNKEVKQTIENIYDGLLCNSNDEIISTEYIEIEKLEARQTKSYELKFKHNKVDMVYVLVTDSKIK